MDYGKNCFLEDCKQLDLLPVECIHCKNTYCKLHYPAWSHNCEKVTMLTTENGPDAPLRPSSYMCTVGECKEKSLVPIYCNSCGRLTCILHKQKESHDCSHLPQVKQEKEVNDNQQIVVVLKEADLSQQLSSNATTPKRRQHISLEDKQSIINAYENGENYVRYAQLLGYKCIGSVHNIVYRYRKNATISTGPIGGYRGKTISEKIGEELLNFIDQQRATVLADLQTFLKDRHNICISKRTVSIFLRDRFVTRKTMPTAMGRETSENIKQSRRDHVIRLYTEGWRSRQCVYIDTTSVDVWNPQRQSHASNNPAPQPIRPIHLIVAFGKQGLLHYHVLSDPVDRFKYQIFISQLSEKLSSWPVAYLINENMYIHNSKLMTPFKDKVIVLPSCSPFLDPSHTVYSELKSRIRKVLTDTEDIFQATAEQKILVVQQVISLALEEDIFKDLPDHYHRIKTYFPRCIERSDVC